MHHRFFVFGSLVALVCATVVAVTTTTSSARPAPAERIDLSRPLMGASVQTSPGQTYRQARVAADERYGGMSVVRYFDPNLPNSWSSITADVGKKPAVISFKAPPAEVAAGKHDAAFKNFFKNAPTDRITWWSYMPEPEDDIAHGKYSAASFRAAFARLAGFASATKNPQLRSTLTLMCYTLNSYSNRNWRDYYPGNAAVDVLAWDCYNWAGSRGYYAEPGTSFDKAIDLADSLGKDWAIAETGSTLVGADTGAKRAAWLLNLAKYADRNDAQFVTYFDTKLSVDYRLRDTASQRAWKQAIDYQF